MAAAPPLNGKSLKIPVSGRAAFFQHAGILRGEGKLPQRFPRRDYHSLKAVFIQPRKGHVFKYSHVRPERKILKHKAEIALLRRQVNPAFPGKNAAIVQPDFALIRRFQPGDHPQKRRFPAAGGAQQRGKAPVLDRQGRGMDDLPFVKALCNLLQSNFHSIPLFSIRSLV